MPIRAVSNVCVCVWRTPPAPNRIKRAMSLLTLSSFLLGAGTWFCLTLRLFENLYQQPVTHMKKTPEDQKAGAGPVKGGQLIRLTDHDPGRPGRVVAALRRHWEMLRGPRPVPDRADVTASGLDAALDYAFILERIGPGTARLRLAGRHLIDLMGMEVRGMPISALLNPGYRGRMSDVLESVFQAPQIAELYLFSQQTEFSPALPARMLLLPLKSDLGDITRILGCLIAEGQLGITPRRFDLVKESLVPVIEGAAILEPGSGMSHADGKTPMRGLSRHDPRWRAERSRKIEEMLASSASPADGVQPSSRADWGDARAQGDIVKGPGGKAENGADDYKGPRLVISND